MTGNEFSIVYEGPVELERGSPTKPSELPVKTHFEKLYGDLPRDVQTLLRGYHMGQSIKQSMRLPGNPSTRVGNKVGGSLGKLAARSSLGSKTAISTPKGLFLRGVQIGKSAAPRSGGTLGESSARLLAETMTRKLASSTAGKQVVLDRQKLGGSLLKGFRSVTHETTREAGTDVVRTHVSPVSAKTLADSIMISSDHPKLGAFAVEPLRKKAESALSLAQMETPLRPEPSTIHSLPPSRVNAYSRAARSQTAAPLQIVLWDLDANIGLLDEVDRVMNNCQDALRFLTLNAPVPSGLISQPPKVLAWARTAMKRAGKRFGPVRAKEIRPLTLIDSDFYRIGKAVSSHLMVQPDVLVGIAPAWIAGIDESRRVFFDFFSSTQARMAIVTTTDMRRSAEKAGRPIEVAVALTVVAQVLVGLNRDLHFHEHKDRVYCLFDVPDIDQWIRIVRRPAVEGRCLDRMKPAHREAVLRILEALDKYKRPELAAADQKRQENAG